MQDEAWDETVEDRVVVVAVQTMLEEIAAGEWDLLGEEGQGEVALGGVQDEGGSGLGFEVIEGGHGRGGVRLFVYRIWFWL